MNIERATELTRQAHADADALVGRAMGGGFDDDEVQRIANAEGWLAAALVAPERELNPEPGVRLLSVTLTEGLVRAWWSLADVGSGAIGVSIDADDVYLAIDRCADVVEAALAELDLTYDHEIVWSFI
jgi:hypothetical protein